MESTTVMRRVCLRISIETMSYMKALIYMSRILIIKISINDRLIGDQRMVY